MKTMVATFTALTFALTSAAAEEKRADMSQRASGEFEVKVEPVPGETPFPRLTLKKTFHGDLEGTSAGEMMSVDSGVKGSGAYVAIERVTGSLRGRKGSFALIHNGTMRRGGEFNMVIKIVPDSGTDDLSGLTGTMEIVLEGGKHLYNLDYVLPPSSVSLPG